MPREASPHSGEVVADSGVKDRFEVLAAASSAGGIYALRELLGSLPAEFPVPILIVQHLDPHHRTVIADVIGRCTPLRVKLAEAGEAIRAGVVYLAPPDRHLLLNPDRSVKLSEAPLVHFVRPSADLLFGSVAEVYGTGVIACLLTGTGQDGAAGVRAVKAAGGTVIVQDPASAEFPGMPRAGIATGDVDLILPLSEIAEAVLGLCELGSIR